MQTIEQAFESKVIHELVLKYIPENIWQDKFTERERIAYNMRSNGAKFREIAAKFNVSQERARQLYYKARRKLQYYLRYSVYDTLLGLSKINEHKSLTVFLSIEEGKD